MKTINVISFTLAPLCALLLAVQSSAQTPSLQISWLASRVHPQTGLVDAFVDGQDRASLYANAVAAIAFAHAGRFDLARGIFQTLQNVYETSGIEGRSLNPGGLLYDQRHASQPFSPIYPADFRTGENAWLIIALNFYESVSCDQRFAALATNLLEAICWYRNGNSNSFSYGAFRWNSANPAFSTEFQIDIYAALKSRGLLSGNPKYLGLAADLREYLLYNAAWPLGVGKTKVWLPYDDPLFNGELYDGDTPTYLDAQALAVLALYPPQAGEVNFTRVLNSIDGPCQRDPCWQALRETVVCEGISVTGFSPAFLPGGVDQDWVWLEGTEFVSAAYHLIGNTNRSQYYHQQVAQLVKPDGSLYHSCANDGAAPTNRWPDNYRVGSADATSWFYFVQNAVNPFVPPVGPCMRIRVSEVEVCWTSATNATYRVEYRSDLTTNTWVALRDCVASAGTETCIYDKVLRGQPQRFYRVVVTNCVPGL